jgi:hypothetical protein
VRGTEHLGEVRAEGGAVPAAGAAVAVHELAPST